MLLQICVLLVINLDLRLLLDWRLEVFLHSRVIPGGLFRRRGSFLGRVRKRLQVGVVLGLLGPPTGLALDKGA